MPKSVSLHIGLNSVDSSHYQDENGMPWNGALTACEFDANDMEAIAKKQGVKQSVKLLTAQATADAVIDAIKDAAKAVSAGGLFLVTYSGHGGQVPDTNHDEGVLPTGQKDRMDETWVMYDRQLVDDELYALWSKFKSGVRIFALSDSCHSGSVLRNMPPALIGLPPGTRFRRMPLSVVKGTFKANQRLYSRLQKDNPSVEETKLKSTALLISGCMDNQVSLDGARNGLFTEMLKKVWANGKFKGAYKPFRDQIVALMPGTQTPNYFVVGKPNPKFEAQRPFTV